jgi:hypothetical protein
MNNEITNALNHAARFAGNPVFSLFGTTSKGHYTLLITSNKAADISEAFSFHASERTYCGLECRMDGVPVNLFELVQHKHPE